MRTLLALAIVLFATASSAAPRASAVELFAHGRALAAEGKCAEAIPFFLDTLKLEPSVGALLNLAECHDKLHDDTQAYVRFREAESLAREKGDDREPFAKARADELGKRVPRIVVEAPARVEIPKLVPIAIGTSPPPAQSGARRTAGIVVTLAGAAGVATGAIFGGVAIAKKSDELALSTGPSQTAFEDARAAAHAFGDASTAAFIAGGVLAVAGLVVWLTAPRAPVAIGAHSVVIRF